MTRITNLVLKLKVWKDTRGQDLIEYALMAGFVAVAAGAIMPGVASSISTIFSKISSVMTAAARRAKPIFWWVGEGITLCLAYPPKANRVVRLMS